MAETVERLIKLRVLLADCGMEKTVTTLIAEAAQVGKTNKAVQAFLKSAVAQNNSSASEASSENSSSTSFQSANEEPQPVDHGPPSKRQKTTSNAPARPNGPHPRRGETNNRPNTPFCRIKPEDVVYADDRLKDNRYLSKGSVQHDFGYKAHQDLIVTRGRSFTKEKNKKKRGS
ncbi:jun-like transcription factor, partial [Coemansia sp. RSA 2702]